MNIAGSTKSVYVSWIDDPEQFWIQPVDTEDTLAQLSEDVQAEYITGGGASKKVAKVTKGMAVVAQFTDDECWYRAVVESVGEKITVRFVDYGNTDTVTLDALREITDTLMKQSAMASCCSLADIRPLQSGKA